MIGFLDKIEQNKIEFKDKIVLCDDTNKKGITYGQLDLISGKVYSYLKQNNIGKEDFVMICLPRSMKPIICLLGVWKAGAAFVLVEDNYAPERIDYIKKDCNCKLVIDLPTWEKIQCTDYLEGHEEFDPKAAAFAVYTSGTTGNPKGVLHEYGNLDLMIDSVTMTSCEPLTVPEDRFALVAPLNFVASLLITVYGFYNAIRCYIVPYATVKNPLMIGMFILSNHITGTFLTPSYIRTMDSKPPMLKFCIIGSEPANEVYLDGLDIHNFYLMSESGFALTHFKIDKKYKMTPVGKSECGHDIFLLDDDGNRIENPNEEGEVCFENPFVRGYIGLEEETKKVFVDGIYHTGDLAYFNEDQQLVICGRLNDMVKINGNRVEPAEIENITKKVLGVSWAAARIFDDGRKVYICAYYTENKKVDFAKTRKEMEQYLPYYMLPSYFIHIDEVPLLPNGKMNRKALPEPDIEEYMEDYEAPRDELEKKLCDSFAHVLKLKKVGIKDDFYQLGGDSLASMDVLVDSEIEGLTTSDIFAGHTPEKIAELYRNKYPDGVVEKVEEIELRARKNIYPLTPYQSFMVDYQLYTPKSTMWNLYSLIRFDLNHYEIEKVKTALLKVLENHPAFSTMYSFNDDGEIVQSIHPELISNIYVEKLSELEFQELKNGLVAPYTIINGKLYRAKIYETEKAGYLFFDVHHTIFDGTSSQVFIQDLMKAYYGMDLEQDHYYKMLDDTQKIKNSSRYEEHRAYFEEAYPDSIKWSNRPALDFDVRENTLANITVSIAQYDEPIYMIEDTYGIGRSVFFCLVNLLSIAIYNKKADVKVSWTYNGRDTIEKLNSIGLFLCDLPMGLRLKKKQKISDLYKDLQVQANKGIEHSAYPYNLLESKVVEDDNLCVLYQRNLRDTQMEDAGIQFLTVRNNKAASENILDVEILDGSDGLTLYVDYASSCYKKESMDRFIKIIQNVTEALCENIDNNDFTVYDLIKLVKRKMSEGTWFIHWIE